MSRYGACKPGGITVAYGLDHVLGWFYQEFNSAGECIKDEDTMFTSLGRGKLVHLLEQTDAPKEHISNIALDLDPSDPQGRF